MFGQVLDKLDTWLGRSFLLARYFPWLLFFAANLLLASVEFPEVREFLLAEYGRIASSEKIVDLVLALGAVAVVAYTISPATQPITRLLEGESLWRWIAEPLLLRRAQQVKSLAERRDKLFLDRIGLPSTKEVIARLADRRAAGERYKTVTDPPAIAVAETEIAKLRTQRYLNRPIKMGEFGIAVQALSEALERNCADLIGLESPVTEQVYSNARKLDKLHREMTETLAPYAIDIAQHKEAHAFDARDKLFAGAELAPTRLGNDVAALRSYCDTRYGFDFDFFWPRLQLVMKDEKLAAKLATAKIQVDFSILSLTLSALLTAIWLLVLGVRATSFVSLLLVVAFGPPVVVMWLWMVHESYSAFAELVRGAIDISRFDLLQALRRPLPTTTEAEKDVWEQTARLLLLNEHDVDVTFKHPAP
jgi:hypothetical protein